MCSTIFASLGIQPDPGEAIFSYGNIRKASNILAHHLIKNGLQREDVVMVYAHRSVDLVVAVMAVLKAGATFSVIGANDHIHRSLSAYIAERSCLSSVPPDGLPPRSRSSRSCGSDGAGKIGPTVREFISTEIKIKWKSQLLSYSQTGPLLVETTETVSIY